MEYLYLESTARGFTLQPQTYPDVRRCRSTKKLAVVIPVPPKPVTPTLLGGARLPGFQFSKGSRWKIERGKVKSNSLLPFLQHREEMSSHLPHSSLHRVSNILKRAQRHFEYRETSAMHEQRP